MPPTPTSPALRLLARLLGLGETGLRTVGARRHLREVGRLAGFFAAFVLAPAVLLAAFALSSIRTEERLIDLGMAESADAAATQVLRAAEQSFSEFEGNTRRRVRAGQSPLANLGGLSRHLRLALRFDQQGELAAPFVHPERSPAPVSSARHRRALGQARLAERDGDALASAAAWAAVAAATREPALAAEAKLAEARWLAAGGRAQEAEGLLSDVYAEAGNHRSSQGFRVGDLASLMRAEIAFTRDPAVGAVALQELVTDLLDARWTLGRPGEAAVARRALLALDRHADPDWLGAARASLTQRTRELHWAEGVTDQLDVFRDPAFRAEPGAFRYYASPDARVLWATLAEGGDLYAFSFDLGSISDELKSALDAANRIDATVRARFVPTEDRTEGDLVRTSLAPWLPFLTVVVAPAFPDQLAALKSQKRNRRVLIIGTAVAMAVLGVLLSARLVGIEIENARMKADFAANVSHELRSPITQIRLKAESLQLDLCYDDEDRRAHYDAIVRESERLSRLVDNILDFAAIERGAKTYTLRPEDLGAILRTQLAAAEDQILAKALRLEAELQDDLPTVWVDREALGQVLTNLISNAIKYGADGGVVGVRAWTEPDAACFAVYDKGMGMTPADLARVFEHFFRSDDPRVRRRKGTGIGLTIVRYIVEEHRGTIGVESAPGEGTTFTVRLPLTAPPPSA